MPERPFKDGHRVTLVLKGHCCNVAKISATLQLPQGGSVGQYLSNYQAYIQSHTSTAVMGLHASQVFVLTSF